MAARENAPLCPSDASCETAPCRDAEVDIDDASCLRRQI